MLPGIEKPSGPVDKTLQKQRRFSIGYNTGATLFLHHQLPDKLSYGAHLLQGCAQHILYLLE
jgi:hypothetical protein